MWFFRGGEDGTGYLDVSGDQASDRQNVSPQGSDGTGGGVGPGGGGGIFSPFRNGTAPSPIPPPSKKD